MIVSDRSFVFSGANETRRLLASVVREDGSVNENAVVQLASSNPSIISVAADGLITSHTSVPDSVTITVTSGHLQPVTATAIIADLTVDALLVSYDHVADVDHATGWVTLDRFPGVEALRVGTVLLSGDRAGLLHRVQNLSQVGDRVVVQTVPADLTDAFENLMVDLVGVETPYEVVLDEDGARIMGLDGDLVGTASLADLRCTTDGGIGASVHFTGASMTQTIHLRPRLDLEISDRTVRRFDLYTEGVVRVTAVLGEVSISGGARGSIACEIEGATIPLAFLPVAGPLGIAPTVTPTLGVDIAAEYTLGSLNVHGPRVDKGVRALTGLGYTSSGGFRVISDFSQLGDGASLFGSESGLDQAFELSLEPGLRYRLGISAMLGPISLARFDLVDSKVFAGAELRLRAPFSARDRGYTGPQWAFTRGAYANLNPLLEGVQATERLMRRIGIPAAASFTTLDLTLFDFKTIVAESPKPTLTVTPAEASVGEGVSLGLVAPGAAHARVEFLAFGESDASAVTLVESVTDAAGNATAAWTAELADVGRLELGALVHHGVFSAVGFPYGVHDLADLVVEGEDLVLTIDPPGLSAGEANTAYSFTLSVAGLPDDVGDVIFEWSFGDGHAGSLTKAVTAGRASTVATNTYATEGAFGLVAAVREAVGGDLLTQESVLVTIGDHEEREIDLEICEVWSASRSGGFGATVDHWDIRAIPTGATFDIRFDALNVPDKFIIEHPSGYVVLDTGWRGDGSYDGNPTYPGGVAGPGLGIEIDVFNKHAHDAFKVSVIGAEPGTLWSYEVRCRVTDGG